MAAMLAATAIATPAWAQSGSDVVVMRRVLAKPNRVPTPTLTPTTTPTPTPSPTPASAPDTYSWQAGAWSAPSSTCSGHARRTRSLACVNQKGATVDEALCGAREPTSDEVESYTGCTHDWTPTGTSWNSQCSATAVKTTTYACVRGPGATGDVTTGIAPDAECVEAGKAKPAADDAPVANYTQCTYSDQGASTGSTATPPDGYQSDAVHVVNRSDGTVIRTTWLFQAPHSAAPACDARAPAVSDSITCHDGGTMALLGDEMCPFAKPGGWTAEDTRTCVPQWSVGQWSDYTPNCSATSTRTRSVECLVYPANPHKPSYYSTACTGTKPATTEVPTVEYYGGCTNTWEVADTSYASTCSDSTTQTTTMQCRRTGGTRNPSDPATAVIAPSWCGKTAQDATVTQPGVANYDTCAKRWSRKTAAWSATCGAATKTDVAVCVMTVAGVDREVADTNCASLGTKPTYAQDTSTQTSSCTYTSVFSTTYSTCSNGQKTAPIATCRRSDGVNVSTTLCTQQQSAPVACGSCTAFATNSAPGNYTASYVLGSTTDEATAQALCVARVKSNGQDGYCTWNSSATTNWAGWPAKQVTYVVGGYLATNLWTGTQAASLHGETCTGQ